MRKGLFLAAILSLGMVFSTAAAACSKSGGDSSVYTVEITNVEEMQADWLSDDPSRTLALTITKDGEEQNVTQAVNDGVLTFASSDTAVATVIGRVVTPVGAGTATITATYGDASDSVEVTVTYSDPHGKSADDPLSVTEAIAICEEVGTTSTTIEYYVEGVVTSIGSAYSSTYNNITILIGDTKTSTSTLTCYRVVPGDGVDPTIIAAGSEVLVSGTLVLYNGTTPEINQGGTIHSATEGDTAQEIEATVAEALAACMALTANTSSNDIYIITGYVVAVTSDGFYMSDTKGEITPTQDDFLVYGWKGSNVDEITVDAKVKVTATLKYYVSSSIAGKYAYETNTPTSVEILEAGQEASAAIEATVAEALTVIAALDDGATTSDKYAVTGVVAVVTSAYNATHGNISFTMGDTPTDETLLTVFRLTITAENAENVVANAKVTVTGYLQKYVKNSTTTPELVSGTQIEFLGTYVPELTGIELSASELSIYVGGTSTLTVSPLPSGAELDTVTWSSDDETVATVADGVVTGVATGTATITATCGEFSATCAVTVSSEPVAATSVTLDQSTLALVIPGDSATLTATVLPSDTTDVAVWSSDDETVATVADGVVTPVAVGTANITVTLNDDVSATCVVTVTALHGTTQDDPLTIDEAYAIAQLVSSNNANDGNQYYIEGVITSINTAYNSEYGNISVNTLTSGGNTFVLYRVAVTSAEADTMVKGATVMVKAYITKYNTTYETASGGTLVSVDSSAYTLAEISGDTSVNVGSTITLTATAYPVSLGTATFSWASSDETVATVAAGVVTGVATGTVTITATSGDLSATYSVTVNAAGVSTATLAYSGTTNTTAADLVTAGTLTSSLGLDTSVFTVTYDKNGASSELAVRTDGIRMYATKQTTNGNKLTVTAATGYTISSITINFDSGYSSTAQVLVNNSEVTGTSGTYAIDASAFTLFNNNSSVSSNTQVRFQSITIAYTAD